MFHYIFVILELFRITIFVPRVAKFIVIIASLPVGSTFSIVPSPKILCLILSPGANSSVFAEETVLFIVAVSSVKKLRGSGLEYA